MAFLGHLCLLASGLVLVLLFAAAPRQTAFVGITLVCGYIGSSAGFFGTVIGLAVGAALGGAVAGLIHGIGALMKPAARRQEQPPPNGGLTIQEFMRQRDAAHAREAERQRRELGTGGAPEHGSSNQFPGSERKPRKPRL